MLSNRQSVQFCLIWVLKYTYLVSYKVWLYLIVFAVFDLTFILLIIIVLALFFTYTTRKKFCSSGKAFICFVSMMGVRRSKDLKVTHCWIFMTCSQTSFFSTDLHTFCDLRTEVDQNLFHKVLSNTNRVSHHLIPPDQSFLTY